MAKSGGKSGGRARAPAPAKAAAPAEAIPVAKGGAASRNEAVELEAELEPADDAGEAVDDVVLDVEPVLDVDADSDAEPEVDLELAAEVDDGDLALDVDDDLVTVPEVKGRTLPSVAGGRLPEALSALNVYLARLKHVRILPLEEQAELATEFQKTGSKDAASKLVASNLRLVVKIAFQFRRQWADVMDLIAEGNLGLAEAIRKFDATRGIPFPSYARFWIRARILAFIQENKHLIHAGSRAARKLFWRLERERRQLISEGLDPEPKRLAERVGVSEQDIRELAPILDQRPVSLDVPVHGDEDGRTRGEVMADVRAIDPEEAASGDQMQGQLKAVFAEYRDTLDERERAIWDLRLATDDPVRLEDLGDQFGVSKERVRQLEVRIKKRLGEFVKRRLGQDVIVEALGH